MGRRNRFLDGTMLRARVARWTGGQRGLVRSVQRATITITGATSNTATITAVDVGNARVVFLGSTHNNAASTMEKVLAMVALTNSTTVTASVNTSPGASSTIVSFEVIEYWPGVIKSVQRSTVTVGTPATLATTVDATKAQLDWLGCTNTAPVLQPDVASKIVLTNGTTVTATDGGGGGTHISGYQVVEWY